MRVGRILCYFEGRPPHAQGGRTPSRLTTIPAEHGRTAGANAHGLTGGARVSGAVGKRRLGMHSDTDKQRAEEPIESERAGGPSSRRIALRGKRPRRLGHSQSVILFFESVEFRLVAKDS